MTCYRGGFIASGPSGLDRAPLPCLPLGMSVDPREGCGEVQTPLLVPRELWGQLKVGDPVFFRPAKAGELAEVFDTYLLHRGGEMEERVKTYRGCGQTF